MNDEITPSLERIIEQYYEIEKKHWEENDKPKNHIFHDLQRVAEYLEA